MCYMRGIVGVTREAGGHGFETPWGHEGFLVVSFSLGGCTFSAGFYNRH